MRAKRNFIWDFALKRGDNSMNKVNIMINFATKSKIMFYWYLKYTKMKCIFVSYGIDYYFSKFIFSHSHVQCSQRLILVDFCQFLIKTSNNTLKQYNFLL